MKEVKRLIWEDNWKDETEELGGLLIDPEDVENHISTACDQVYIFSCEPNGENIKKLLGCLPEFNEADDIYEVEEAINNAGLKDTTVELAGDSVKVSPCLVYSREARDIENLADWEGSKVYEYWDGSNWKELWLDEEMTETEVTYNPEARICLDEWDGSNWRFQSNFNHAYVVPLIMVDGQDAKGDYLFVEYTDYQGNIPTAKIIGPAEAEELLKQQQEA